MSIVTLPAHFDGQQIKLDRPYDLKPNARLLVTVLPEQETDDERKDWLILSEMGLANAYAEDEVDYPLSLIKEANPEYAGR